MDNENNSQDHQDFKFPPEGFEVFSAPEIPEDGDENNYEVKETKKHIIRDANGNEIFKHESNPDSDWQKKMTYDEQNRLTVMESQKLIPGQESHTLDKFEYDEKTGEATKTGSIEFGQDAGHIYKELPIVEKNLGNGRVIKTITTEVLEQGENGSGKKAEKGTIITKTVFMKNGKWQGDKVTGTDDSESEWLAEGVKELPNWE
ncbi:MAG: hypothetical protein ACNFW9_02605 [Candidatus Kerfeldbacteria bacterium]